MSDAYFAISVVFFLIGPLMACWIYPRGRIGVLLWLGFGILSSAVFNIPADFGLMDEVEYNEGVSTKLWFLNTIWNAFWMFVGGRLSKEENNKIL